MTTKILNNKNKSKQDKVYKAMDNRTWYFLLPINISNEENKAPKSLHHSIQFAALT